MLPRMPQMRAARRAPYGAPLGRGTRDGFAGEGRRGRSPWTLAVAVWVATGCSKPPTDDTHRPERTPELREAAVAAAPGPTAVAAVSGTPAPDSAPPSAEGAPSAPHETGTLAVLSASERELLSAGPVDLPIPVDTHYIQSNETYHDLYFPYIEDVGGAYVGVGSDQSYTMMAKARAELAFLLDIDARVVDLHHMYEVFILASETPEALLERWSEAKREDSMALLEAELAAQDDVTRRQIVRGYAVGRETVYRHLERVIGRRRNGVNASWLSDPELYAHVRALFRTGRVRMMPGDLTGSSTLQSIAQACKALAVPVKVLYMSNAEEYFRYGPSFVANIEALPSAKDSVVLRTIYNKQWEHADLWAYQVQPLDDFKQRLGDGRNRSRNPMFRYAEKDGALERTLGIKGFSRLGFSSSKENDP